MKRAAGLLLLALAACGRDPTVVSVRNLERPSDMGFVCVRRVPGPEGAQVLSGRPMSDCRPHLLPNLGTDTEKKVDRNPVRDPNIPPPRPYGSFGLVTNTARGELAVVDLDANGLVDLDPTQPGYNMVPLGTFPEVLTASQDGCLAATANRGSCDLSVIDSQRLLSPVFGDLAPSTGQGTVATRVTPTTGSGVPLRVAPQEIAFLPQSPDHLRPAGMPAPLCSAEGAISAGGARVPWRAVVTFPACDLVAVLELPSGRIVSSVYVRPEGIVDAGTEPVCPTVCGTGIVPQPAPDAAPVASPDAAPQDAAAAADANVPIATPDAADPDAAPSVPDAAPAIGDAAEGEAGAGDAPVDAGSGVVPVVEPGPYRIGALVIRPEGNRLYVGGASASFVTAIDLVNGTLRAPADGGRIFLHDGAGGVTRLRLSIDPFGETALRDLSPIQINAKIGKYLGRNEEIQFMYAFARDNSMRVIDVTVDPMRGRREGECDLQVDPLFTELFGACHRLPDDPTAPRPRRRPLARGPGLRIPTVFSPDLPPPVPLDIAFASVRFNGSSVNNTNKGDFGYVLGSDQNVYVLNLELESTDAPAPANTFRNGNLHNQRSAPRVTATPARNFSTGEVPLPTRVTLRGSLDGPRLEGVPTKKPADNVLVDVNQPAIPTWVWFTAKDPLAAVPQTWTITWEGALPNAERSRGTVKAAGTTPASTAGALEDLGAEFCQVGALPRDIVLFHGCMLDTDCVPPGGATSANPAGVCRQSSPGTPGLCFPAAVARDSEAVTRCQRHLASRRRYEVARSTPQQLELALKLDELPKTSLDRCNTDADCRPSPDFEGFACLQVRDGEHKRCVKPCGQAQGGAPSDDLCRAGTVCEEVPGSRVGPLCVEGPKIIPECWPTGATYRVQAGQSFLVAGSATPRPSAARQVGEGLGAVCAENLDRNSLLVARIPLDAPHCASFPDEDPNRAIPTTDDPDTYSREVLKSEMVRVPDGPPGVWSNPCLFKGRNTDDPDRPIHTKAYFRNQQLRFLLTNLDVYAGDTAQIRFDVSGAFAPERANPRDDIVFTAPARLLTGPTSTPESPLNQPPPATIEANYFPYLYLIDQGRTATAIGGRGQVLRLNPRGGRQLLPIFDSIYAPFPFQIQ